MGPLPETFPKWQILVSFKFKVFADNNFELDENGRKFSKWVENTVGKGKIACYEQFLLFPPFFSEDLNCRHVKTRACLGKGLKRLVDTYKQGLV